MPRSPRSLVALAPAAATILWLCAASSALALDLLVDTGVDNIVDNPLPGPSFTRCDTNVSGDCSLRGAILRANAVPGPHTITLAASPLTLSIQNPSGIPDDNAMAGDLDIAQTITINGAGTEATVITWLESIPVADRDRVFHVLPAGNLTIRDVTIRQGGRGNGSLDIGGGIRAQGPLTVERSAIRINAQTFGGGVAVSNNTIIRSSTINNNAAQFGAGLYLSGSSAYSVLVENSTISTNVAIGPGGGIYAGSSNANTTLTLNNVTVAQNTADVGGGLAENGNNTVLLRNTIVADGTATSANPNCSGTITSEGYNLLRGGDTCGMGLATHDIIEGTVQLSPLGDNGGPTATHALGSDSAALDNGNPATPGSGGLACAATDQRGLPRTIDGDGNGTVYCDIGAAEGGRWFMVDTATDYNALQTCDDNPNNANCSLRGAISVANTLGPGRASVITLPATGAGNPYRLTIPGVSDDTNAMGDLDILSDITIVGGGAATTIVDANHLDRVFDVFTAGTRRLKLQDLTVQNGSSNADGGGIRSSHLLSLLRVRLRANTADGNGGGIFISGSNLTITESTVSGNVAQADGDGGGIYHEAGLVSSVAMTITNSTIAQNQADFGGALFNSGGTTVNLKNVTIAGNTAATNSGGLRQGGPVLVNNSIIAGNTALTNPNCGGAGTPNSQGFNLVFGGGTCGFSTGKFDIVNTGDPKLGPLQLNGGTTETMALGPGSAAIDAGNPTTPGSGGVTCAATDQRGTPRPIDGNGLNGATDPRCDIGAFEAALCTTRPNVLLGVAPGQPGRLTVTVTAGTGNISQLLLHATPESNIQVSIGALVNQSGELAVPINAPTAQFTIRRASGTGFGTLKFDVIDGCNLWHTLAGGGPNAWPPGVSSVNDAPADNAQRTTPTSTTAAPASAPAVTPPGCSPQRPNVGVTTVKTHGGQLQTTLSAETSATVPINSLRSVRIGTINNATVTLDGRPVTPGQTVTLPAGTRQATLIVDRDENAQRAYGVGFTVTDVCGDWGTFVGSGSGG